MDFGNDEENPIAKLIAARMGREPTPEENAEHNKIRDDAINLSSGVLGTIGGPAAKFPGISGKLGQATPEAINTAEQTAPSWIEKYKQAVANTKVRQMTEPMPNPYGKVIQKGGAEQGLGKVTQETPSLSKEDLEKFNDEDFYKLLNRTMGIK